MSGKGIYCREGKDTTNQVTSVLEGGDCYAIPANVTHSIEIIEDAEELQVFSPPRLESM